MASFRFGQHGATAALLLLTGIAVWDTAQDQGPFVGRTLNESLILLQAFISVLTVTDLALAGIVSERGRAERVQASLTEEDQVLTEMKPSQNSLLKADTRVRSVAKGRILGLVHRSSCLFVS